MTALNQIKFISVEDREPSKDETSILAMHYRDETVFWIASIWYHSDSETWVCDFTDDEFNDIGFHSFTHWTTIDDMKL